MESTMLCNTVFLKMDATQELSKNICKYMIYITTTLKVLNKGQYFLAALVADSSLALVY